MHETKTEFIIVGSLLSRDFGDAQNSDGTGIREQ